MNLLSLKDRARILGLLVEGNNFGRVHKTLRVTPAAAGITDHVGTLEEIAKLAD